MPTAQPSPPLEHVLFLVADQWRGDALGQLGTPGVLTPCLDALAARSVTFTSHWTDSSPCGPSRRSMLTGRAVTTHGQWTNDDVANTPSLAGELAGRGRRLGLIGYTDTPQADGSLFDPGFDLIREFFWQEGFPSYRAHLEAAGVAVDDSMFGVFPLAGSPDDRGLAPTATPPHLSDAAWLAGAALNQMSNDMPAVLHVNWLRPHPPIAATRGWHRLIDPDAVGLPTPRPAFEHPFWSAVADGRRVDEYVQRRATVDDLDETDVRHLRAAYYGMIHEVDTMIGRVLDGLDNSGLRDRSLVVFSSDHGDALGDHGLYGRRGPFDGHFRVPCIIHDPRPAADETRGTRVDSFTSNLDIMPSIFDALGEAVPDGLDGSSLLPYLHDTDRAVARDHIVGAMDFTDHVRGAPAGSLRFAVARTETHRLVRFTDGPDLLFDVAEDPDEQHDLAADPTRAAIVDEMGTLLPEVATSV